ncbi:hypothetical protein ACH4FE_32935 [Streptomyces celluloflavus]|uniref:hypothetical protein n=1 Tax=Streptomyces celluloflavus TaxID=58344 RepID=UPI0037B41274
MTTRETVRTAFVLAGFPALLLAVVALVPPEASRFLCAALLGASVTAVCFALTGRHLLSRRKGGGRS